MDEIEFVWTSELGLATLLYYATRYTAVPELCVQMLFMFGHLDDFTCRVFSGYISLSIALGMIMAQGILVLRTWALWNGSRKLIIILSIAGAIATAAHLYLNVQWIVHTQVIARGSIDPGASGCEILKRYESLYIGWIVFCVFDVGLIFLTFVRYRQDGMPGLSIPMRLQSKVPHSKLLSLLYRDAFIYFTLMLLFAAGNLAFTLPVADEYCTLLYGTERLIYSSLACRIVRNLRSSARAPIDVSTISSVPTVDWTPA